MALELVTVPCLTDNYAFLIHDAATGVTAVVDVPEDAPIAAALTARGWALSDILLTHHHHDHIDGVAALRTATGARVTGAAADAHRLPPLDRAVRPGEIVAVGAETGLVIDVPGHTVGHIAYHFAGAGLVFTGDSLMVMGCGRISEGTPAQMWASLSTLAALPPETLVCSGHEYAASNARFALSLEPQNAVLMSRAADIDARRTAGQPTVPAPLSLELATNPFLRAGDPSLKRAVGLAAATDPECFTALRARKDRF